MPVVVALSGTAVALLGMPGTPEPVAGTRLQVFAPLLLIVPAVVVDVVVAHAKTVQLAVLVRVVDTVVRMRVVCTVRVSLFLRVPSAGTVDTAAGMAALAPLALVVSAPLALALRVQPVSVVPVSVGLVLAREAGTTVLVAVVVGALAVALAVVECVVATVAVVGGIADDSVADTLAVAAADTRAAVVVGWTHHT